MTNEQIAAAEQIREIADKNNLVVAAIWCADDILSHYNEDKEVITYDEAENLLFEWENQIKDNAIENGYEIIYQMLADEGFSVARSTDNE